MMLIKLFLFFLLLLILPDMYIYKAYIRRVSQKWTHWAYWLPSLFLLLGMTLVFSIHEPRPDSMQRLSNFLLIFLCFSVPKALFVIVILFMKLLYIISGKKLYGGYVAGGLALASLIYVIYGATEGKQHFQIREVTISSDELPSGFDGYRIVQISDIHSGSWTGNGAALQKAVNLINAQHADLVLFTGDLVNNVATELDEFIPILEQIKGKDGVYSVLGNHDYSPYIKWETEEAQEANLNSLKSKQAAMGWKILNNDHVILHHHGDSIALAGVENSGNPPFPNYGDLQKALKGTEGENSPLFLAPFFNVTGSSVCLGNAALTPPEDMTFSKLLEYWEKRFWLSEFSHLGGSRNPTGSNLVSVTEKARANPFDENELKPMSKQLKDLLA